MSIARSFPPRKIGLWAASSKLGVSARPVPLPPLSTSLVGDEALGQSPLEWSLITRLPFRGKDSRARWGRPAVGWRILATRWSRYVDTWIRRWRRWGWQDSIMRWGLDTVRPESLKLRRQLSCWWSSSKIPNGCKGKEVVRSCFSFLPRTRELGCCHLAL